MSPLRKLKKFLKWTRSSKPDVNLNTLLYEQLKYFRLPLIFVVLMMMIGTMGYVFIAGFTLKDAFYQAAMAFTTVGFGEVEPISQAGRIFTIVFILLGFILFSFSIGVIIEVLKRGILISLIKERNMIYKIARLKNHFIICYQNNYTQEIAKQFRESQIPFVVIDNKPNLAQIAETNRYPYYIIGEPHIEESLLKAHISSAKGIITLGQNIADNIAIVAITRLYEKEIQRPIPYFIMTTADYDNDAEKLKKLGADSVVLPSKLAAQRITAVSARPDMENILEKFVYQKNSAMDIEEITIPEYSWIRFKRIKETRIKEISNVSLIGIRDSHDIFTPMPKDEIIIGSDTKLLVIGTADGIRSVRKLVANKYKPTEFKYA